MTIQTNDRRKEYPGNGVATVFTGPRAFQASHIAVYSVVTATGVATLLTSGYTLTGVGAKATTVTMDVPPATGTTLLILRTVPYEQAADISNQGAYLPETLENAGLDPLAQQIQQLDDRVQRALRLDDDTALPPGTSTVLRAPEPLKALRWNTAGNAIENFSITPYDGVAGADLIGFQQSGLGMVLRTLLSKARDLVHADDRGCIGDGTSDDTAALQALFNAAQGKVLMLGYGKTYGIATGSGLTIPANTTLIANGSKFKRLTARSGAVTDAEYNITVGDDCIIDTLEVVAVGGASDIGGVCVSGNRVRIGKLKVTAPSAGAGSLGSLWNAVRIGPNSGGAAADVHIGEVSCQNFDRPVIVQNLDRWSVGFVRVQTYSRGVYVTNCTNGAIRGGSIGTISPNATGSAGENGILVDTTTGHGNTHDIRIHGVTVEDSGEHGIRVGGQYDVRNVWIRDCHVRNSGSGTGTYPPGSNGGCGIKIEGPTSVFGARHQNIHVENCSVEDINATSIANLAGRGGKSNFAGVQFCKVFGGSITNLIVTKRPSDSGTYGETGNSCFNGIEIIGCQKVTITNPQVQRPYNSGVYIYDFTDGTNDWGQTDDIDILGGHVNTPGVAGVEVDCSVITMRRITVNGLQANAGLYALKVNKTGTGAFVNCSADMVAVAPATEGFTGLGTDWSIRARGDFVGANACKDGSIYQDGTNGTLKRRVGGAWSATPYTDAGTWTPTFTLVTNVDAATVNGSWKWSRMGNIVTFAGSVNIDNTTASIASELGVSLTGTGTPPPASNFTGFADAIGTAVAATPSSLCGTVQSDATNDRLAIKWQAGSTTDNRAWFVTGSYEVK